MQRYLFLFLISAVICKAEVGKLHHLEEVESEESIQFKDSKQLDAQSIASLNIKSEKLKNAYKFLLTTYTCSLDCLHDKDMSHEEWRNVVLNDLLQRGSEVQSIVEEVFFEIGGSKDFILERIVDLPKIDKSPFIEWAIKSLEEDKKKILIFNDSIRKDPRNFIDTTTRLSFILKSGSDKDMLFARSYALDVNNDFPSLRKLIDKKMFDGSSNLLSSNVDRFEELRQKPEGTRSKEKVFVERKHKQKFYTWKMIGLMILLVTVFFALKSKLKS